MSDRNRELVPDNWSLVRERALTTGLVCVLGGLEGGGEGGNYIIRYTPESRIAERQKEGEKGNERQGRSTVRPSFPRHDLHLLSEVRE